MGFLLFPRFFFFQESYEWSMLKIMLHIVGWHKGNNNNYTNRWAKREDEGAKLPRAFFGVGLMAGMRAIVGRRGESSKFVSRTTRKTSVWTIDTRYIYLDTWYWYSDIAIRQSASAWWRARFYHSKPFPKEEILGKKGNLSTRSIYLLSRRPLHYRSKNGRREASQCIPQEYK